MLVGHIPRQIAKILLAFTPPRLTNDTITPLSETMPAASLQAMLAQSIDYAGMFPPCSLGLEPALRNQAEYVRLPDRWMLGAFVLPVEQFDAAKQLLSQFDPVRPLRVAALGARTENAVTFAEALVKADAEIGSLSRQNVDLVSITHLEM